MKIAVTFLSLFVAALFTLVVVQDSVIKQLIDLHEKTLFGTRQLLPTDIPEDQHPEYQRL